MIDNDIKILILISGKESDFAKEIAYLASLLKTEDLSVELADYLSGLNDLKNDFLRSMLQEHPEQSETAKTFLADRFWLQKRT